MFCQERLCSFCHKRVYSVEVRVIIFGKMGDQPLSLTHLSRGLGEPFLFFGGRFILVILKFTDFVGRSELRGLLTDRLRDSFGGILQSETLSRDRPVEYFYLISIWINPFSLRLQGFEEAIFRASQFHP